MPPAPSRYRGDASITSLIETVGDRIAGVEHVRKPEMPQSLWVQEAPTAEEAAYRWLAGMAKVLKEHGAYRVAIDNYRAVYPRLSQKDAEKMFAGDLMRAMFDPIPESFTTSAAGWARGRLGPADSYRWDRVTKVLDDSGAYAAGIAHYQVYRVQRLAQFCRDWTTFLTSRGMDEATAQRYMPDRPQMMSWEKADSIFGGLLLRDGNPQYLSRHLYDFAPSAAQWERGYA
jgi:hypothetical protein